MSTDLTPPGNEQVVPASPNPTPPHKKFSRRKVLAFAGTGTLVLLAGGGVWRAADQVKTAGAFGLLAVRNGQDRKQQLGAGILWERMHLWATKEGLAMQPLNQVVERAAREVVLGITPHFGNALAALVGDPAWQTQLAFRTGYSTHEGLRSPRRSVDQVVKP
jgi:hypothetical protein